MSTHEMSLNEMLIEGVGKLNRLGNLLVLAKISYSNYLNLATMQGLEIAVLHRKILELAKTALIRGTFTEDMRDSFLAQQQWFADLTEEATRIALLNLQEEPSKQLV